MTWRSSRPAPRRTTPAATGRASRRHRPSRWPPGHRRWPGPTPTRRPHANAGRLAAALGVDAAAPRRGTRCRRPSPRARRRRSSMPCGRRRAGTTRPSCSTRSAATPTPTTSECTRRPRSSRPGRCRRSGSARSRTACCPIASRRLAPHLDSAPELNLHRFSGMLRSMWDEQVDRVPRLGRVGDDAGRRRRAARAAPAHPGAVGAALAGDGPAAAVDGVRLAGHDPRPAGALAVGRHRPSGHPARPAGADPVPHRVARRATRSACPSSSRARPARPTWPRSRRSPARGDEGRRELNLRQDSIALLEALLAFAAVQELDKAASAELVDGLTVEGRAAAGFVRRGVRTPDLVRVEDPDPQRLADAVRVGPRPRRGDRARVPARGARPGGDAIERRPAGGAHRPAGESGQRTRPVPRRARRARGGTGRRARVGVPRRARPLQLAPRRLVHIVRHRPPRRAASRSAAGRSTSGATAGSRTSAPTAVRHADSLGYIAAPSLAHAVSAALLRSGREAHRAEDAFDLDLSSARVREALKLLEGVAAGQPLAALLGYRIERKLTDAGLAALIVGLRIAAPLQARGGDLDTPVEVGGCSRRGRRAPAARHAAHPAVAPVAGAAAGERGAPGSARSRPARCGRHVRRGQRRGGRRGGAPDGGRQPRSGGGGGGRARPPGSAGRARRHPHASGRCGRDEPGRGRAARLGDGPGTRLAGTRGARGRRTSPRPLARRGARRPDAAHLWWPPRPRRRRHRPRCR